MKCEAIDRAGKRKRKPLAPYKVLNKLWAAESALKEAYLRHVVSRWKTALDTVKLRDAQNVVLHAKLRRAAGKCSGLAYGSHWAKLPARC